LSSHNYAVDSVLASSAKRCRAQVGGHSSCAPLFFFTCPCLCRHALPGCTFGSFRLLPPLAQAAPASSFLRFLSYAPVFLAFPPPPLLLLITLNLPCEPAATADALSGVIYSNLLLRLLSLLHTFSWHLSVCVRACHPCLRGVLL
jgi:hypothetical protein